MPRKTLLALLALVAVAAALPATASAKLNISVGLGDQAAQMFNESSFKRLKVKKVRYFIRWDGMRVGYARRDLQILGLKADRNIISAGIRYHFRTHDR